MYILDKSVIFYRNYRKFWASCTLTSLFARVASMHRAFSRRYSILVFRRAQGILGTTKVYVTGIGHRHRDGTPKKAPSNPRMTKYFTITEHRLPDVRGDLYLRREKPESMYNFLLSLLFFVNDQFECRGRFGNDLPRH